MKNIAPKPAPAPPTAAERHFLRVNRRLPPTTAEADADALDNDRDRVDDHRPTTTETAAILARNATDADIVNTAFRRIECVHLTEMGTANQDAMGEAGVAWHVASALRCHPGNV
jgi:hypothetical protein